MKQNKYFLFFLIVFTSFLFAQNEKEIKIRVITSDLPAGSGIYITGNNKLLGSWNPDSVSLKRINANTWEKSFSFSAGEKLELKITRGSWATERLNEDESIPSNTSITVMSDTTITFNVSKWADQVERKVVMNGQITGNVEYIRGMKGDGILPRDIIIWLPPGYAKNTGKRYPVLYMQDGQNIIDPATSSFGYDWQVDEVADSLISAGKIKQIIIVGIYNTVDRSEDYSPGPKGYAYEKFIVKKLKPLIDRKYRTLPGRGNTTVAGSSMGGLISFMLIWEYPDVFSQAACLSPALHIDNYNYVKTVKDYKGKMKPVKIYLDIGGVGLEEKLQPGIDEMLTQLKEKGFREGKDLMYFKDLNAEHNEQAWAKRNWKWLEFLFGK